KVFEEERELTVIILVDVSGSLDFGSEETTKRDFVTEIAACLSFSAISNNDKIGVIFFSNEIEKFIPPKKGRQHILRIIRELLTFEPKGKGTDVAKALQYLTSVIKKRSTVFMISDFVCGEFSDALRIAGHKHDLLALNVYDKREVEDFPNVGLVYMQDAETGRKMLVDTSNSIVRANLMRAAQQRREKLENTFLRAGVQDVAIANGDDYVKPLIKLFKSR
ncbi:MAG: VWA domain-containing protein, partial [Bacteroidales bacterium]|nr:VWA domain-containing protein [Bacteroidales bacterium]